MDDWKELTRTPAIRPPVDPQAAIPVATISVFDFESDIVWVGDSMGFVASYAENMLVPYTRFAAHSKPIRQILVHKKGVLTTDGDTVRLTSRSGLMQFCYGEKQHDELKDIKKMTFITPNEALLVTSSNLLRFDLLKNQVNVVMAYHADVILISSNKRYVALGKENGSIDIFDHTLNKITKTFDSHSSSLSDLDLKEHRLVVCGLNKIHGAFIAGPMVQVYDLKTFTALPPTPFPAGAAFVRLHPKLSSCAIISSVTGQIQVIDMTKPTSFALYEVEACHSILSFELSTTGDYLSIIDGYSVLHLWCHSPEHSRMSNRVPLEYPDSTSPPPIETNVDDNTIPLNSVGMPYYKDQLLSAWPSHLIFRSAGAVHKSIDAEIYKNSKVIGNITIAPYDKAKYGRKNLAEKYFSLAGNSGHKKFLSDKTTNFNKKKKTKNTQPDFDIFELKNGSSSSPPNAYKRLEIFYSKFGVDDFDFDSYNQTQYAGLESHVDNSYTNSLLQLYRFVPEFFNFLISNLAMEDYEPSSLLRELGYLYDMLVKSQKNNFRPTNFQYALSNIKEANELGLVEKNLVNQKRNYDDVSKLQLFNRFLLDRIQKDEIRLKSGSPSLDCYFDRIFGIEVESTLRSMYGNTLDRNIRLIHTLEVSLQQTSPRHPMKSSQSVLTHIEAALTGVEQKPLMNERTGSYDMIKHSHIVTSLPPVLTINLHLTHEDKKHIRTLKDWLKPKFQAGFSKEGFILTDTVRETPSNSSFFKEYELVGFVSEISGEFEKDKHLVTFAKITQNEMTGAKKWYLFNDFLVLEVPEAEVLDFSYWWKTPVTLVYREVSNPSIFYYNAWKNGLNDEILYRNHFAAAIRESTKLEYELLTRSEAPKPGSLVAIDTEFVIIEREQYEIKSNGERLLLKPSAHALARVSILRGDDGEKFGVPFIDDYVVVKEDVQDYLTSYSGIEPGDLDPETSNKPLVTREVAFRKIWLLLNLGCVFVGHGLTKDFRTINVCVPKSQIRDTSVFFYKGQRILSLRFLAYILLKKEVQTGNHDSIEDAMTALLIYKEYLKLKEQGLFEEVLEYIYMEGQQLKFKPPTET